jgi:HPt (histidine-containing phosphotransfer) domain-containing protein
MARLSLNHRVQWLPIAVAMACAVVLALLLFTGVRLAARLQSASTALQLASGLVAEPQLMRAELTLIQRGLETQTYVGDSLRALARSREANNQTLAKLAIAVDEAESGASALALFELAQRHWRPLDAGLSRLGHMKSADLYADSATGSTLTKSGSQLKRVADEVLAAQSTNTTALANELARLAALLREGVVRDGKALRTLLLGGAALAALLLVTMLYFAWRAGRSARTAGEAQRQIGNILGTVREGLFLIGRDGRIGGAHSDSLLPLLRVASPAGQSFEELLRPLVDERTLLAATKYLGLLQKDKVNEELIESVNPLSQIEISFHRPTGTPELRYLSFSFRRAHGADKHTDFVLGVVADVTDHVLLQRELEQLRTSSESQSDLLLQLLQTEPVQLQSFLGSVDAAVRHSNSLLRSPGVKQPDLQQKLQGVFRQMHSIKGEAAALGLQSFVDRCHAIEELLTALRERGDLAGNDFVPVVVKLGGLLGHMQAVATMQERMGGMRSDAPTDDLPPARHGDTAIIAAKLAPAPVPAGTANLDTMLRRLAGEVSAAGGREVRLVTEGLERVPAVYAGPVRDICIQMVRNSIAHGIEPSTERAAAGKSATGVVRVRFNDDNPQEYTLLIEDDGQGLNPAQIRDRARDRGLLDAEQAAALDRSGAYRLIFQPGFSTAAEVTEHAGRGVGLDVVNAAVRECGGRIGIATSPGKYTRFKIVLPRRDAQPRSHSSAA